MESSPLPLLQSNMPTSQLNPSPSLSPPIQVENTMISLQTPIQQIVDDDEPREISGVADSDDEIE